MCPYLTRRPDGSRAIESGFVPIFFFFPLPSVTRTTIAQACPLLKKIIKLLNRL